MKGVLILFGALLVAGPALAQSGFSKTYDAAASQPARSPMLSPESTGSVPHDSQYNGHNRQPVTIMPQRSFEAPSVGGRPLDSKFNRGG